MLSASETLPDNPVASWLEHPIGQCYIKDTGTWVATVDEVRTASNSLRIYFDKAPEQGGMVRVIVAE